MQLGHGSTRQVARIFVWSHADVILVGDQPIQSYSSQTIQAHL